MKPLAASHEQVLFWRRHVRTAVLLVGVGTAVTVLYALSGLDGPDRSFALAVTVPAAVAAVTLLLLVPVERVVRSPWGALYLYGMALAGVAVIGAVAYRDGGAASPLSLLLFVLLVHAATAYPPSGTVLVAGAATLTYLWLAQASGWPLPTTLTAALALAATALIGGHAAGNHLYAYARAAQLQEALRQRAQHDGLTGCLNHQTFHAALGREAARASPGRPVALLVIDIDHFKRINDTAGHLVGDEYLRGLGEALRAGTRQDDLVGRIGGDEFAVILRDADLQRARATAARIRRAAKAGPRPLDVSIGVTVADAPAEAGALLASADDALYQAKRAGRDQARIAGHGTTGERPQPAR